MNMLIKSLYNGSTEYIMAMVIYPFIFPDYFPRMEFILMSIVHTPSQSQSFYRFISFKRQNFVKKKLFFCSFS